MTPGSPQQHQALIEHLVEDRGDLQLDQHARLEEALDADGDCQIKGV